MLSFHPGCRQPVSDGSDRRLDLPRLPELVLLHNLKTGTNNLCSVTGRPILLSVALVTRNRPESLERCLGSLRDQSRQPFEVVVSDDSNPGPLAHQTRAVAERWECSYLSGPRRGLYANRNRAFGACRGTHIRAMDDDHTFPAGHLELCWQALQDDPASLWTTGEISFIHGRHHATVPTANQLHPSGVGQAVSDPDNNWAIADGSTIYPREVFDQGLWMVEDFAYGSSYLEFGAYLYRHGFRSRCLPGALVEHHADPETLRRGFTPDSVASRLFASLCFNRHFQPNPLRAWRYLGAVFWHAGPRWRLLCLLPRLVNMARQRWAPSPAAPPVLCQLQWAQTCP